MQTPRHWLLTDECYSHFTYGDAKPYSVASLPGSKDRLIVAGSLSKTFAMTGWRIGYALAPKPLVDAMTKLQSQSTSNPNSITQYAGLEALRGPMDSVTTMLAEYARRRERILAGLRAIPGVTCTTPEGAFYVFPNVSAHLDSTAPDTTAMARELLEREHVAVVPGDAFGAPGHLRISYATSMETNRRRPAAFDALLRSSRVILCPARLEPIFSPRPWGSLSLAPLFPGKNKPHRTAGRSLDDGQRMPLCLRPVRGPEARGGVVHDAR